MAKPANESIDAQIAAVKARTADLQRTNDAKRAEIDKIRATRSSNHTANETAHVTSD